MRSAGFEPAIPSLGSSYLNQAGLTSLAFTDDEFGIIRLLFSRVDVIGLVQLTAVMRVPPITAKMKTDRDQYWILGSARLTKVWNSFLGKKCDSPGQLIFHTYFVLT